MLFKGGGERYKTGATSFLHFPGQGISYHFTHVARLLHALGWSPQKPERRALERNEAAATQGSQAESLVVQ
jgi:transposase